MFDYKPFEKMIVTNVAIALYCVPSEKPDAHTDRTYQGIVMNEPNGRRIYTFSDGRSMLTEGGDIFFLPKGSTYKVHPLHNMEHDCGCYCINFDADISVPPFVLKAKNPQHFLKLFDTAARLWKTMDKTAFSNAVRTVYDIFLGIEKENQKVYMPNSKESLLRPAIEAIKNEYTKPDISISHLAALCGISDTYFRRIFSAKYGISPKEYIINLRIRYAKELLYSGEFSVSRVGELCGYGEPCHFSREFSRIVGSSPSEYAASIKRHK